MKVYTPKLSNEGSLEPLKMNLLVLIVQLIMMSENFSIKVIFARCDSPNKFADLDNIVWSKLMQLHQKLVKNIQEHRVWRYAKASNEKIHEHNRLVPSRDRYRLYARRPSKSFREK
jgi:hypothetical protein